MTEYLLIFTILAYLIGSVPTAVWVGRRFYGVDVREHGSKNAGATNTFRVLGKKPGTIVLIVDVLKGALAVLLPRWILVYELLPADVTAIQLATAVTAVLGHVFPVFAQFNGGKGVATSLGIVIGLHPSAAGICILLFLVVFLTSKYVSLGALVAAFSFPLLVIFYFQPESLLLRVFSVILGAVVILTHTKNIRRLLKGEENKMNLFR